MRVSAMIEALHGYDDWLDVRVFDSEMGNYITVASVRLQHTPDGEVFMEIV